MANNDSICKDRTMALAIIETITGGMKDGTQKKALSSVADWLHGNRSYEDVSKLTPEQRRDRIQELLTERRNLMSEEERRKEAAFYLEGLEGGAYAGNCL